MTELTNSRSERVRSVRSLAGRSARSRTNRFLVEGPQGVREAVAFVPARIRDVYVSAAADARYDEITGSARALDLRVHRVSDEVLAAMSPDAQGILAVVEQSATTAGTGSTEHLLLEQLRTAPRLVAVLSNVRDPGNAGTVIRAADAAGADLVVLAGESVDIYNPKVVRSTAGSLFHLPVLTGITVSALVGALQANGLLVLAADGSGDLDLDDLLDVAGPDGRRAAGTPDLAGATAWVFGNEAWGLRADERALADAVVRVPLRGKAESLNLATAATVCLYASARAQR
ncbi:TrmH family RNA methyltransferase [Sanguibacter antarcticus]|uniref:TrmH family RNA methyltransferase n=1 Tax=Sanguibacter antarcticus TaxID=372484 RepID=A0A2A9E5I5_9MICO|nr:RNA methyltransferase [Sanguibacter antarcticus]PFG33429.1 TrmH family RNA methyltransferase [Sanguibacter antarcticus]